MIFGVLNPDDSCVPVITEAIAGCGRASFYTGSGIEGANNKVRILHNLAQHATGEIIVITDADTRATPDFLARVTAPFREKSVGAVTCMYRGVGARSLADRLEGLHMTCVFAPGVAAAAGIAPVDFALGAVIAIRRSVLEEIGGFEAIADYLADDFQLGRRAARAGNKVELSDYVIDITLSGESLGNVLARELRWSKTTMVSRPAGHFGLIVTFGFPYALIYCISTGFSRAGWLVLLSAAAIRLATARIGARCLGDGDFPSRFPLLPIRDILSFAIWIAGYLTRTVKWRGRKLRLVKGGKIAAK